MQDRCDELTALIALYRQDHAAWLATADIAGNLEAGGEAFEAVEATAIRILTLPCRGPAMACRKIDAVLACPDLYTMAREGTLDDADMLRLFLASLLPAA